MRMGKSSIASVVYTQKEKNPPLIPQTTVNLFNSPVPISTSKLTSETYRDSTSLLHNLALSPRQIASIAREEMEQLKKDQTSPIVKRKPPSRRQSMQSTNHEQFIEQDVRSPTTLTHHQTFNVNDKDQQTAIGKAQFQINLAPYHNGPVKVQRRASVMVSPSVSGLFKAGKGSELKAANLSKEPLNKESLLQRKEKRNSMTIQRFSDDTSVQNMPNESFIEPSMHQSPSMASNLTLQTKTGPSNANANGQGKNKNKIVNEMQKSISTALEKWTNQKEESNGGGATPGGSSLTLAKDTSGKMKNIFQLNKFAKSPSSAQIIFEEKTKNGRKSRNRSIYKSPQ